MVRGWRVSSGAWITGAGVAGLVLRCGSTGGAGEGHDAHGYRRRRCRLNRSGLGLELFSASARLARGSRRLRLHLRRATQVTAVLAKFDALAPASAGHHHVDDQDGCATRDRGTPAGPARQPGSQAPLNAEVQPAAASVKRVKIAKDGSWIAASGTGAVGDVVNPAGA